MNNRSVEDIKNDIKIISTNKLSVSQSKLLLMGTIYEILSNKNIFPKKCDLKKFVNNRLSHYFKDNIVFKDYVFNSRTLLASRVQKEIYLNFDYQNLIELVGLINDELLIIKGDKDINKKNINKSSTEKAISEWRNYFKNKGK